MRVLHGKGDKCRVVGLDPQAWAVLQRWLDKRKQLGLTGRHPVICTLTGEPIKTPYVRGLMPRLAKRAGIEKRVHAHGLRHTGAFELANEGHPMHVIQQQLGHSSLATTERAHPPPEPAGGHQDHAAATVGLVALLAARRATRLLGRSHSPDRRLELKTSLCASAAPRFGQDLMGFLWADPANTGSLHFWPATHRLSPRCQSTPKSRQGVLAGACEIGGRRPAPIGFRVRSLNRPLRAS